MVGAVMEVGRGTRAQALPDSVSVLWETLCGRCAEIRRLPGDGGPALFGLPPPYRDTKAAMAAEVRELKPIYGIYVRPESPYEKDVVDALSVAISQALILVRGWEGELMLYIRSEPRIELHRDFATDQQRYVGYVRASLFEKDGGRI